MGQILTLVGFLGLALVGPQEAPAPPTTPTATPSQAVTPDPVIRRVQPRPRPLRLPPPPVYKSEPMPAPLLPTDVA